MREVQEWTSDVPRGLRCLAAALALPDCGAQNFLPGHLDALRALPPDDALQVSHGCPRLLGGRYL